MTDKEKILAILNRLEAENNCGTSDFIEAKRIAYKQVRDAIDSMHEEPKFKIGDVIKPIDNSLGAPRIIEKVCESWYITNLGVLDFEHESNWELLDKPMSEDLEEAAQKFAMEYTSSEYGENTRYNYKNGFKAGANWRREQMMKDIVASIPPATEKPTKRRCKNDLTQFEIRSANEKNIRTEYDWCLANLPLKEEQGLEYHVTEIFIITRSQRIIDKVNRHFGSSFGFKNWQESRIFYID